LLMLKTFPPLLALFSTLPRNVFRYSVLLAVPLKLLNSPNEHRFGRWGDCSGTQELTAGISLGDDYSGRHRSSFALTVVTTSARRMLLSLMVSRSYEVRCCPTSKHIRDTRRQERLGGTRRRSSCRPIPLRRNALAVRPARRVTSPYTALRVAAARPLSPRLRAAAHAFLAGRHSPSPTASATRFWRCPATPARVAADGKQRSGRRDASAEIAPQRAYAVCVSTDYIRHEL
jgi:hypothetical protein